MLRHISSFLLRFQRWAVAVASTQGWRQRQHPRDRPSTALPLPKALWPFHGRSSPIADLRVLLQAVNTPACSPGCLEIHSPGQSEEESRKRRHPAEFGCRRSGLSLGESAVTSPPEVPSRKGSGVTQTVSPIARDKGG